MIWAKLIQSCFNFLAIFFSGIPTSTLTPPCYHTWRANKIQVRFSYHATVFIRDTLKPSFYGVLGIFQKWSPHRWTQYHKVPLSRKYMWFLHFVDRHGHRWDYCSVNIHCHPTPHSLGKIDFPSCLMLTLALRLSLASCVVRRWSCPVSWFRFGHPCHLLWPVEYFLTWHNVWSKLVFCHMKNTPWVSSCLRTITWSRMWPNL